MPSPIAQEWKDAPPVSIPEPPALFYDTKRLWLAYETKGGHAVVVFSDVIDHRLSPINDEGLGEHPYASAGLRFYAFHEVLNSREAIEWSALRARHWVITFKDNTLDVIAGAVQVVARQAIAKTPTDAIFRAMERM